MADMITRCPQCGTAFRITPSHLKSAKGSVRCGSCLQVFNARENLTPESLALLAQVEKQTAPQQNAQASTTKQAPESPAAPTNRQAQPEPDQSRADDAVEPAPEKTQPAEPDETDDLLISDDMEAAFDSDDVFITEAEEDVYVETPSVTQASLFERFAADEEDDSEEAGDDDEAWALKLLDEEDPTPVPRQGEWVRPELSDSAYAVEEDQLPEQDAWDEAVVRMDDDEEEDPGSTWYEHTSRSGFEQADEHVRDEDGDIDEAPFSAGRRDVVGSAYLDAIEPEPVEFAYREKKSFWHSRMLWGGLSLLAALLLVGQIAWMQYPTLNRTEPYRSFYAVACDLFGCTLPPQVDRSAIRASNLVVRSHPRRDDALMVDVVLQNTAPFPQSFPILRLTFTDLQGNVVAQRDFEPEDYLGGELTGQSTMPERQPIHIALEIVDPGPQAVNYRVDIVQDP